MKLFQELKKRIGNYYKNQSRNLKKKERITAVVYVTLRVLTIFCAIAMFFMGNYNNAVLSIFTLFLFTIPDIAKKQLGIRFPTVLETSVYCFIFAAEVLGEINDFYIMIPGWDTVLHTINGFLCAAIGFCLVDLLNRNSKHVNLSPLFVAITACCFSMTVGVCWEFIEYTGDSLFAVDMQKDYMVHEIKSILINPDGKNEPVIIQGIEGMTLHLDDGTEYEIEGGYLDIGINDTMKDLWVNFVGALVFSTVGYVYIKHRDKNSFAANFIPIVERSEDEDDIIKEPQET
ncbi:MAG: hypothetical protein K6F30_08760 [Lachnospiraceae bacterium]|nr:hypothetical protein [Lachnospiraceae bacterium]